MPDEKTTGVMNVAIYRMKAAPPAYSASVPVTPIYFRAGAKAGARVLLVPPLTFNKGEYVGVLGACGTATMNNSYGTGPHTSKIGQNPVTLTRFLMQANITTNKGVGNVSTENSSIARVFLDYIDVVAPTLAGSLPVLGQTANLDLVANVTGATAGLVLMGRGRLGLSLPLGTLLINAPYVANFPVAGGSGKVNIAIPNNVVLMGAGPINFQAFVLFPNNFGVSNGTEWYLGGL